MIMVRQHTPCADFCAEASASGQHSFFTGSHSRWVGPNNGVVFITRSSNQVFGYASRISVRWRVQGQMAFSPMLDHFGPLGGSHFAIVVHYVRCEFVVRPSGGGLYRE